MMEKVYLRAAPFLKGAASIKYRCNYVELKPFTKGITIDLRGQNERSQIHSLAPLLLFFFA